MAKRNDSGMGKLTNGILYGVKTARAGGTSKHTEHVNGGDEKGHGTTFKYADGCLTIYQHQGGQVSGYHADAKGNLLKRFDEREGHGGPKHPHHSEGQSGAVKAGKQIDWAHELKVAWDRALRMNGLRK